MAAPEYRYGFKVQHSSRHQSKNRPIFFDRSRCSLVLKPLTVFCCHRIIIQHIPLGNHSMRVKELSNILIAPIFNQLQWMSTSSSCCISTWNGIAEKPWAILKTSIKSERFRRSSKVHSPTFCNLPSCCNDLRLLIRVSALDNVETKQICSILDVDELS